MNPHSVSAELATVARKTRGMVPPKLVGASTTVVGNKMYLFGGRLVVERRMLADLYVFDLETFTWDKIEHAPGHPIPGPRYFHSADTWNNHLVVFGGMGYKTPDQAQESLCVLNDVCFYSLAEQRWLPADDTPPSPLAPQSLVPRARYAHLSSISSDMLFIIGGQDLSNGWLDDIHVYNLSSRSWVHRSDYPRHCGTYRSVALSSNLRVRDPSNEPPSPPVPRFRAEGAPSVLPVTPPESLVELPYSCAPTNEFPSDIFLYSNYNFTDVKRELEVFTPQPPASFSVTDRSTSMTGVSLPPGLRFPTGAILGNSLIIAGTYLAHSYQAFSIWSLDLTSMQWSRIEPGTALATGSWCRAVLWRESNKLLVFGNREGNLVEDYNHRLLSWDHVAYIDLEAFGIYQPPSPGMGFGRIAQEVGLAALEDGALADFEVLCDDNRRIPCSRKMLEERWPWFHTQRQLFVAAASAAVAGTDTSAVPALPSSAGPSGSPRPDPRLTPRTLHLAEPFPITLAFLQYLYTQTLVTPLQQAPPVLSALMLLSTTYEMGHLRDLVKHAMHRALSSPANQTVSGVYDVATLCDCQSLRLRAMRLLRTRRPPGRARQGHDRHGGSSGGSGHGRPSHHHHARPRGMSDANTNPTSASGSMDQGNGFGNGQTNGISHSHGKETSMVQESNQNRPSILRRPSQKRRSTDLDTVSEVPSPSESSKTQHNKSLTNSGHMLPEVVEYPASEEEDDLDPELFGLESLPSGDDLTWSSGGPSRVSYNARPSSSRYTNNLSDQPEDDYFFGTQPDHSPLTTAFPVPEKTSSFHLPYPTVYHSSRSASISDVPSFNESRSTSHSFEDSHSGSGTRPPSETPSSSNSSAPMSPLTPALAEIVDAVAKVQIAPERRLSRQTSLRSINEHEGFDDPKQNVLPRSSKRQTALDYPSPPSSAVSFTQRLTKPAVKSGNVSATDSHHWLRIDTTISPSSSPGESLSSLDLTPSSAHSLSTKGSFDRPSSSDRRASMTPVPQSGGGLARFLSPKRSNSRLEKDLAKARSKADKLEQKLRQQSEKEQQLSRDQAKPTQSSMPNLLDTISKLGKPDDKKWKKDVEKQKIRSIAEQAKLRADRQGFEGRIGQSGETFAVSGVGGL